MSKAYVKRDLTVGKDYVDVEGSGSGSRYSTDERVIGSWIDGRPLYQKTVTNFGLTKNVDTNEQEYIIENNIVIVSFEIYRNQLVNVRRSPESGEIWMRMNSSGNGLLVRTGSNRSTALFTITFVYLKTTD